VLTVDLYPYQNQAVDLFLERDNLLVAYEMGLGKTIIGLAAIEELLALEVIDTAVVVVPAALKYQWAKSIAKHTDVPRRKIKVKGEEIIVPAESVCIVLDGTPAQRDTQYATIQRRRPEYIIMSYENVVNDWKQVSRIKPGMIVLDEATAIKSFRAQRTKKIKRLSAPYRMALTGTPVENRPEETFSIMQWVDSDVLGRFDLFDKTFIQRNHFGGVERYKNLDVLHRRLKTAMSRKTRLDPDVAPYLPDVDEDSWIIPMDATTKRIYKHIGKDLLAELDKSQPNMSGFDVAAYYSGEMQPDEKTAMGRIMAREMALSMLLAHPDLLRRSGDEYALGEGKGSRYANDLLKSGVLDGLRATPKMDYVVEQTRLILESHPDNKVIIFSVFPFISNALHHAFHEYRSVRYHGQMNAAAKAAAQSQFERDPMTRLFLSSHAGGYGVDLFMANHLINYDLAWSSGKQDQINARHVRASSKFDNVFIHNALTERTVEQRRYDVVALKRKVARAVVDGKGAGRKGVIENNLTGLKQFLIDTL
jgi:SNF2 family DNA or RNA helicase